jgi:hypothetical protein
MKHLKYFEYDRTDIFGKKWRTGDDDIINEHDVVYYYGSDEEIPYGSSGTVVHINAPNKNFIVEFIMNDTSIIKSIDISDLRKV